MLTGETNRKMNGQLLYNENCVKNICYIDDIMYAKVNGNTGKYVITKINNNYTCNCKDIEDKCKHIYAVILKEKRK